MQRALAGLPGGCAARRRTVGKSFARWYLSRGYGRGCLGVRVSAVPPHGGRAILWPRRLTSGTREARDGRHCQDSRQGIRGQGLQ